MSLNNKKTLVFWLIFIILFIISGFICKKVKLNQNIVGLLPDTVNHNSLYYFNTLGLINKIFIDITYTKNNSNISNKRISIDLEKSAYRLGKDIEHYNIFTDTFFKVPSNYQFDLIKTLLPYLPNLTTKKDIKYINSILNPTYIKKALITDFTLLNTPLTSLSDIIVQDPLGLSNLLVKKLRLLKPQKNAYINNNGFLVSKDRKHILIWTTSKLPLTDAKNAEKINGILNKLFQHDLLPNIKATVIGSLPHTLANSRAIKYDLKHLLPITTIALLLLFLIFFRDIRLLCAISIPFLCAPIAIFITAIILKWHIYAIALGFGIVLLGIAIDYSVHIYFSLTKTNESINNVLRQLRKPLISAYLTTIGVFIVLLFSEVPSHRQMALLSIIGLSLSFLASWLLVPTLVTKKRSITDHKKIVIKPINNRTALLIVILWCIIVTIGFFLWSRLHYNVKLTSLEYIPKTLSRNENLFHKTWGYHADSIFIITNNKSLAKALDLNDKIYHYLTVKHLKTISISTILPGKEKQYRALKRWDNFWRKKKDWVFPLIKQYSIKLGISPSAFKPFFYRVFNHQILRPKILLNSDIKPFIKNFIINKRNQYYILTVIYNKKHNHIYYSLRDLSEQLPNVHIISNFAWQRNVERSLHRDLLKLSIWASIIIFIIVWIYFRNTKYIIATLLPVISSLSAMSLFNFFTEGNINILNILMGIMIIGLSVDYGIFIVSSFNKPISESSRISVTMCALSTLIGFGALALAHHPALKSLGTTVLVGILAAWPTAIWIIPAFLSLGKVDENPL